MLEGLIFLLGIMFAGIVFNSTMHFLRWYAAVKNPNRYVKTNLPEHQNSRCVLPKKEIPEGHGRISFLMTGVQNTDIVEHFARAFSDAATKTHISEEFCTGKLRIEFKFENCSMSHKLIEDLSNAGLPVKIE